MSIKAFKQTDEPQKPKAPAKPNEPLVEEELQDVAGGLTTTMPVAGDGYATCC